MFYKFCLSFATPIEERPISLYTYDIAYFKFYYTKDIVQNNV